MDHLSHLDHVVGLALRAGLDEWLHDALHKMLQWFLDVFLWIPRKIFELFTDGLVSLINSIVPPSFVQNIPSLPEGVHFWLNVLDVPSGVGLVMSAWVFRFLLRRIPVIG